MSEVCRVLVIDDSEMTRTLLSKEISAHSQCEIILAPDGQKGWEHLEKSYLEGKPVDIIISDWNMPSISGIELLQKVRKDKNFSKTYFIMVTAEVEMKTVLQAIKAGANDYITKPVMKESLQAKIKEIFANFKTKKSA